MDIKYSFRNEEAVQALKQRFPDIFQRNMVLAAKVTTRDVQRTARAKHRFRSRSGDLEMAIDTKVEENGTKVQGKVFIDDSDASYGVFVHQGTGPHWIKPKNKKALRWATAVATKNGGEITANMYRNLRTEDYRNDRVTFRFHRTGVWHPGTKPDKFIYEAGEANQQHINDVFNRYADRAIKEVGL